MGKREKKRVRCRMRMSSSKAVKQKKRIQQVRWDCLSLSCRDTFRLNGVWHSFEYQMFGRLLHLEVMKRLLLLSRVMAHSTKQHSIQRMAATVKRLKRNRF